MSGHRITKAELELRVTEVHGMLVNGLPFETIVRVCREKHGWDVKPEQIRQYVYKAGGRLEQESKARREVELGKAIARYTTQYAKADARKDHRGAAMIQGRLDELLGLQAPKRTEHSGPDGGPIPVAGSLAALEEEIVAAVIATIRDGDDQD